MQETEINITESENTVPEPGTKRIRRTPQQLADAVDVQIGELKEIIAQQQELKHAAVKKYDDKIKTMQAKIKTMEDKKQALLNPAPRKPRRTKKQKLQEILEQAQKSGKSLEEIAAALSVDVDD